MNKHGPKDKDENVELDMNPDAADLEELESRTDEMEKELDEAIEQVNESE